MRRKRTIKKSGPPESKGPPEGKIRMYTNQQFHLSAAYDPNAPDPDPEVEALLKKLKGAIQIATNHQEAQEKKQAPPPPVTLELATPNTVLSASAPTAAHTTEPLSAVARCVNAYNQTMKTEKQSHSSNYDSEQAAERAYINKIPMLDKAENINDFIACVTYAMLVRIIRTADGTKLLYAAQIANQANQAKHKIANSNKSTPETPK